VGLNYKFQKTLAANEIFTYYSGVYGNSNISGSYTVTVTDFSTIPYTVTYNGNGHTSGSAPIDNNTYTAGSTVTVKSNTGNLSKTNYIFLGWSMSSTDTSPICAVNGSNVAPSTFIIGTGNVTFYAVWQPVASTITLVQNSGTIVTITSGYRRELKFTAPSAGTYNFESSSNGTLDPTAYYILSGGTIISDDEGLGLNYKFLKTLDANETFTFYSGVHNNQNVNGSYTVTVTYVVTHFTVTYDGNGHTSGCVPTDSNTYTAGSTVTVKSNTGNLTKTNCLFLGWSLNNTATTPTYAVNGTTVSPPYFAMGTTNVTLYAVWQPVSNTITLTQSTPATVTITSGGRRAVQFTAPSAWAYIFESSNSGSLDPTAYDDATGGNVINDDGGSGFNYQFIKILAANEKFTYYSGVYNDASSVNGNYTVMVTATPVPYYSVTYNGNGNITGNAPTDCIIYSTGSSVTVKGNEGNMTRANYVFLGWSTSSTATTPTYTVYRYTVSPPYFAMGTANVTLYAVWQPVSNGITLTINTPTNVTITSGGRRVVQFTAPTAGTYDFESSNCGKLDPMAYSTATEGYILDDDGGVGCNYKFQRTLDANETFTYYSGTCFENPNENGSYTVIVTDVAKSGSNSIGGNGLIINNADNSLKEIKGDSSKGKELSNAIKDLPNDASLSENDLRELNVKPKKERFSFESEDLSNYDGSSDE